MASRITFVNPTADHVLVVASPSAGSRNRLEAIDSLVSALKSRGLVAEVVSDLSAFDELWKRYREAGQLRAVVAAGGDGTVAALVNRTEADVPLTVFPLGTANLLANYFGLTLDPQALADAIVDGAVARLDAGKANGRIFVSMVGCGFDAEVVHDLHAARGSGHISQWTYAGPIVRTILNYRYPTLQVEADLAVGERQLTASYRARWAFVINLPDYGGGFRMVPEAVGTDGVLDLCLFNRGSLFHGLKYVALVKLGLHPVLSDWRKARVTRVRITADEGVRYQLDGDPGGFLPLEVEVLPERISLVAPRGRLSELGLEASAPLGAGAT